MGKEVEYTTTSSSIDWGKVFTNVPFDELEANKAVYKTATVLRDLGFNDKEIRKYIDSGCLDTEKYNMFTYDSKPFEAPKRVTDEELFDWRVHLAVDPGNNGMRIVNAFYADAELGYFANMTRKKQLGAEYLFVLDAIIFIYLLWVWFV